MIPIKLKLPFLNQLKNLTGLQMKMLLFFILSVIIPMALTGIIAFFATLNSMEKEALKAGPNVLEAVAGNLNQLTQNIEMVSSQIARDPEIVMNLAALNNPGLKAADRDSLLADIDSRFKPWITSNHEIERIYILVAPRTIIQNSPENADTTENTPESGETVAVGNTAATHNSVVINAPAVTGDTLWYRQVMNRNGGPLWSNSLSGSGNGRDNSISCIRLIQSNNSVLAFLLVIQLDPRVVNHIVSRTIFADGGKVYLIAPGQAIFQPKPMKTDKKVQPDPRLPILREMLANAEFQNKTKNNRPFTLKRTGTIKAAFFYQPLRLKDWCLLGAVSEPEWTGPFLAAKLGYVFIIILFSGLAIGGSFLFSKYWSEPLPNIKEVFQRIASGAPACALEVRRDDDLGLLAKGYNRVLEKFKRTKTEADLIARELNSITGQIMEKTREVTDCSVSILNTLDELTEATANEASEVISCISNISLLTESVRTVNDYADLIQQMKTDILQLTTQGKLALENLELRSQETKTITIEINRLIYNLNEQTQEIQDIVTRIREIVVQTDMISLNATIEATRIKDIKKEVLALAHDVKKHVDHSASAVRKITEVILRIENKTNQATSMAEVANEAVETQNRIIQQCAQIFNDIRSSSDLLVEKFEAVIELMGMVEDNKNEIMALTEVISNTTGQIAAVTQTLAASFQAEQTAMVHLNENAGDLEKCMTGLMEKIREYDP